MFCLIKCFTNWINPIIANVMFVSSFFGFVLNGFDKVFNVLDEQLKMIFDKLKLNKIRKGATVLFRG